MIPSTPEEALALTMLGEARNQGAKGMEAVGHTIINRVNHPSWRGNSIMQVCLKPWQYSCWNQGDPNRAYLLAMPDDNPAYILAYSIANNLIQDNLSDFTEGATYYKVIGTSAAWAKGQTPCFIYLMHEFYKDIA